MHFLYVAKMSEITFICTEHDSKHKKRIFLCVCVKRNELFLVIVNEQFVYIVSNLFQWNKSKYFIYIYHKEIVVLFCFCYCQYCQSMFMMLMSLTSQLLGYIIRSDVLDLFYRNWIIWGVVISIVVLSGSSGYTRAIRSGSIICLRLWLLIFVAKSRFSHRFRDNTNDNYNFSQYKLLFVCTIYLIGYRSIRIRMAVSKHLWMQLAAYHSVLVAQLLTE